MTAFEKWFKREYSQDPGAGAKYLYSCILVNAPNNVVWDYLEKTGDSQYTAETFVKAAELILARSEDL